MKFLHNFYLISSSDRTLVANTFFYFALSNTILQMYVSDNNDDMTVLNRMCVSAPFLNPIFMHIANQITEFLFPKRKAKQKVCPILLSHFDL